MEQQNSKKDRRNPSFWVSENCNVLLRVVGDTTHALRLPAGRQGFAGPAVPDISCLLRKNKPPMPGACLPVGWA